MSTESVSNTGANVQADDGQAQDTSAEETLKSASTEESEDESAEESETSETDDQAEKDESEEDDDDQAKEEEIKPKKNKVKNRIDKLRSRISERDLMIAERDREIEFLRRQSRGQSTEEQEVSATKPVPSSEEPDPEQFDTYKDYTKALTKWTLEQAEAERKAKESETQLKESFVKRNAEHQARVKEYAKSTPGYQERVQEFLEDYGTNGDYQFSPALQEAFMEESGPMLMDELLKDPEELVRLNGLGYGAALRSLGKLEARIQSKKETSEANAAKPSKAPAPVSPIGKSVASVAVSLNDPKISFEQYEKERMKQLKNKK